MFNSFLSLVVSVEVSDAYEFLEGASEGTYNLGVDERIILK
jgi:hypothetical protein